MTMSGNSIMVTVGTTISGTLNTGVTTTAHLKWTSIDRATDVAGNTATGTRPTRPAPPTATSKRPVG